MRRSRIGAASRSSTPTSPHIGLRPPQSASLQASQRSCNSAHCPVAAERSLHLASRQYQRQCRCTSLSAHYSPVALELCPDLHSTLAPGVTTNVPVQLVGQVAPVQRLDVRPVARKNRNIETGCQQRMATKRPPSPESSQQWRRVNVEARQRMSARSTSDRSRRGQGVQPAEVGAEWRRGVASRSGKSASASLLSPAAVRLTCGRGRMLWQAWRTWSVVLSGELDGLL